MNKLLTGLLLIISSVGYSETSFQKAYKYVMSYEGYYANHVDDFGGETYCGITKKFNPRWFGWRYVNTIKNKKQNQNIELANFWVRDYYLDLWVDGRYEEIYNHKLAGYLFDYSIHTFSGIQKLEMVLLNKGFMVKVDNSLDSYELLCINLLNPNVLLRDLEAYRKMHYQSIVSKYPKTKTFLAHWLTRAKLTTLNKAYG